MFVSFLLFLLLLCILGLFRGIFFATNKHHWFYLLRSRISFFFLFWFRYIGGWKVFFKEFFPFEFIFKCLHIHFFSSFSKLSFLNLEKGENILLNLLFFENNLGNVSIGK